MEGTLFGVPKRTALLLAGGVLLLVVVAYVLRSRSTSIPQPIPQEDGGFSGGGGGGSVLQPVTPTSDPFQSALQAIQLEDAQARLGYNKAMGDFAISQRGQELSLYGEQLSNLKRLLPFQEAYQEEQLKSGQAAQAVVTRSIQGKSKVECPKGQHLVVLPDGSAQCQDKGGKGFNLGTIFTGIGEIATGVFRGAAKAAPEIGYGAAKAYTAPYTGGGLAPYGTSPTRPSSRGIPTEAGQGTFGTPPINPYDYA